jgi:hypothetical protein
VRPPRSVTRGYRDSSIASANLGAGFANVDDGTARSPTSAHRPPPCWRGTKPWHVPCVILDAMGLLNPFALAGLGFLACLGPGMAESTGQRRSVRGLMT